MTDAQKKQETTDAFLLKIQASFQMAIFDLIADQGNEARVNELPVGLGDISFHMGSGLASALHECLTSLIDAKATNKTAEGIDDCFDGFTQGFYEKLELLFGPTVLQMLDERRELLVEETLDTTPPTNIH